MSTQKKHRQWWYKTDYKPFPQLAITGMGTLGPSFPFHILRINRQIIAGFNQIFYLSFLTISNFQLHTLCILYSIQCIHSANYILRDFWSSERCTGRQLSRNPCQSLGQFARCSLWTIRSGRACYTAREAAMHDRFSLTTVF